MARPLLLLNVVGLTHEMLGAQTPHLKRLAEDGFARPMGTVLPAVTCSAQATLLTGTLPREHGIVANGWYFRDLAEVLFWRQSNRLVRGDRNVGWTPSSVRFQLEITRTKASKLRSSTGC